jgi:hypothetical protein
MPKAQLPTTPKGWIAAVISSLVGFVAGLWSLALVSKWLGA